MRGRPNRHRAAMPGEDLAIMEPEESFLQLLESDIDLPESVVRDMEIPEDISEELYGKNYDISDRDIDECTVSDFSALLLYVNGEDPGDESKLQLENIQKEINEDVLKTKCGRRRCISENTSQSQGTLTKLKQRGLSRSKSQPESPPAKRRKKGAPPSNTVTYGNYFPAVSNISYITPPKGSLVVPALSSLHSGNVPVFPALVHQQALNYSVLPFSSVIICTASPVEATGPFTAPTPPTPCNKSVLSSTSIPSSPDRHCSSSPFAPSEVDLPNSPESASMCQQPATGKDECGKENIVSPLSQKEKLKNERVASFEESLKKQHREASTMDNEALYTDPELVISRVNPRMGKHVSKTAEKELVNYDLAEQLIERVQICRLFGDEERKGLETRIIALVGDSGMGKTVLVRRICRQWSMENLKQFSFVFYFECQKFHAQKQYSLKDFLFGMSSCPSERNIDVYQYILRNPEKILLIFDGFDEFQDSESLLQGSSSPPPGKAYKAQEIFTGLFQRRFLRGCTMLITARPREKLNQHLGKVDQIVELMGFTPQQVEWYIEEYFKARPDFAGVQEWMKGHEYLYSHCYIPLVCRCMCLFAESNYNTENKTFSTSELFIDLLEHHPQALGVKYEPKEKTTVDASSLNLTSDMKCALHTTSQCEKGTPSYGLVQSFFKAQHALQNMNDRNVVRFISLDLKRRRNLEHCPDMVRRLLLGLLYCKKKCSCKDSNGHSGKTKKRMTEYFQTLRAPELCPRRLLELFHCVYATHSPSIAQRLASTLSESLSFMNTRLNPPDVIVLQHILKRYKGHISLDLRRTSISQEGLQDIISLKSVSTLRASLGDTVSLWKKLLAEEKYSTLRKCVMKFTVEPFRAESLKDITDLAALLDIQRDICNDHEDSPNDIKEIPAIRNLNSIAFGLGKKHGQDGFLKLLEILPRLPALQHLDLCNLTENHIGDKGVEKLVETFSELKTLHTLDLSQNNITGVGAKILADALPSLCSLQTLSLYNNYVCDMGAQELADVLPKMESLEALHLDCNRITDVGAEKLSASLSKCPQMKSLRMYNTTIPHGMLQRLQQQDPRISCLSIG